MQLLRVRSQEIFFHWHRKFNKVPLRLEDEREKVCREGQLTYMKETSFEWCRCRYTCNATSWKCWESTIESISLCDALSIPIPKVSLLFDLFFFHRFTCKKYNGTLIGELLGITTILKLTLFHLDYNSHTLCKAISNALNCVSNAD